ncbi:AAA family ATPase [Paenibacillus sp. LMG 31459]|uniref:DNA 3'-5' helicase n=1 Tax=Paenibacillus phytohabitans TaxID=2654978 RepID=A0ABX1YVV5_9BACL|nr:ATP-dependent helicase [Paenibacillus phytohabitans]NOU83903.1 AAA family ATPase [Paenibacillus phytohabitans]
MSTYYQRKLDELFSDDKQAEAYMSEKNTVVIAGPGSGKTTVLTLKIMKALQAISQPRGLACITYSRAAAAELKSRLKKLGCSQSRQNVFVGTVHSFCIAEIIKPFSHLYPTYEIPETLDIISEGEKKALFAKIKEELGYGNEYLTIEEMDKERSLNIEGLSEIHIETYELALNVAQHYERTIKEMGKIDFMDIVKFATLLIQKERYVRLCLEARFPWIFVDEYQDLGKPLHEMILSLFNRTSINFFVVGDPDQSIYGFNGAMPDYLKELGNKPEFSTIKLSSNYRSTQQIVDATELVLGNQEKREARAIIDKDTEFHFIQCESELLEQYEKVAHSIIPECVEHGIPYNDIAVLVANNTSAKELAEIFKNNDIPYYLNKLEYDRSEVVIWLEQCATWVLNHGSQSFSALFDFWLRLLKENEASLDSRSIALEKIKFMMILQDSIDYASKLSEWLKYVFSYLPLFELLENSRAHQNENENLEKILEIASSGNFENFDISRFAQLGKPDDQITISTRHSSKGLEFEVVILLGMEENNFPNYFSINDANKLREDYRLFFVCISRAKRVCYLLRSQRYTKKTKWGLRTFDHVPSRFWVLLHSVYGNKH